MTEESVFNTIGKFNCRVTKMRSGDMPFPPGVEIILDNWTQTEDGDPCVTSELKTEMEIDAHVEMLKKDLDVVGARAKGLLATAKAETWAITSRNKGQT